MSLEEQRSWMYSGWNEQGHHYEEWVRNTTAFLDHAFQIMPNADRFGVKCPCTKCRNGVRRKKQLVRVHLCQYGFMPNYTRWTSHGERPIVGTTRMEEDTHTSNEPLVDMLVDIIGAETHFDDVESEPTTYAKEFYKMLSTAEEVIHDHTQVSRLAAVTRLMGIKSQHNLPADCVNSILGLLGDVLPKGHKMPSSFYECKNMLGVLKMPYVKIDVCTNNCMLYYKQDEKKEKCDISGESQYEVVEGESSEIKHSRIPRKVMRYLPITARLQRMYMSAELAKHMRWHKEGERSYPAGIIGHPSEAEAWKDFDREFPEFAKDARNVRLVIATDGFNPFKFGGSQYSCWPVFVSPLNLPPALCMSEENIFLTFLFEI